jgi:hypothetical protein
MGPGRQVPAPSHTLTPTMADPWQVPVTQTTPGRWFRQLPAPSHLPSRRQLLAGEAGHAEASRGSAPFVRGTQVPGDPSAAQVMQAPVQAWLQQTPSAQNPLAQSLAQLHAWPAVFLAPELQEASGVAGPSTPPSCGRAPPWPA